jgi:hypothetical protein
LNFEVLESMAVSGRLLSNSKTSVLVCVASIGKVFLYSPREGLNPLNINKTIKCLSVAKFHSPENEQDVYSWGSHYFSPKRNSLLPPRTPWWHTTLNATLISSTRIFRMEFQPFATEN